MTDLFGGALSAAIPQGWVDASDLRPVPDHQEIWLEQGGASRMLAIEILERVDATDDMCAAYHFEEVVRCNDAPSHSIHLSQVLEAQSLPHFGEHACCARLSGSHTVPKEDGDVKVELAVVRLAAQSTDLLVLLTTPPSASPISPIEGGQLLLSVLGSLAIHDWALFAGDGAVE